MEKMVRLGKIEQVKNFIESGVYNRPHNEDAILDIVARRIALILGLTQGKKD